MPESNTPSGALFMDRQRDAETAGDRLHFEVGWEIAQMRGDVCFGARKEVIEDPQHEPVLHLLPLLRLVWRIDRLHVLRLLMRLQRHHGGHTFPGYEHGTGHG